MITIKYVILKSFRDPSGMRLPGELIELAPSRAAALRGCGLIGGEHIEPEQPNEQTDDKKSSDEQEETDDTSTTGEPEKSDEQLEKTETPKSTESESRKRGEVDGSANENSAGN